MEPEEKKDAEVESEAAEQAAPGAEEAAPQAAPEAGEEPAEEVAEADEKAAETGDSVEAEPTPAEEVEAAKKEAAEMRDRYTRLQAEWDNFRKRTRAERDAEKDRAAEKLVVDLLPVLDDMERAIKHAKDSGEGGTLTDGVVAVQTKFLQILGKHKVEQIEAAGQPFDAYKHQAVGTREDESVPEETVVEVYQQGYTMGDKIIRPAMVVTSTGGPARAAKDPED